MGLYNFWEFRPFHPYGGKECEKDQKWPFPLYFISMCYHRRHIKGAGTLNFRISTHHYLNFKLPSHFWGNFSPIEK